MDCRRPLRSSPRGPEGRVCSAVADTRVLDPPGLLLANAFPLLPFLHSRGGLGSTTLYLNLWACLRTKVNPRDQLSSSSSSVRWEEGGTGLEWAGPLLHALELQLSQEASLDLRGFTGETKALRVGRHLHLVLLGWNFSL